MPVHKRFVIQSVTLLVCCVILCAGCGRERTEDARFERLSKEFLEEYLRAHPSDATCIGEHRYDRESENMSRGAIETELVSFKSYLARLESVDETKLSRDNRIDAEVLKNAIGFEILEAEERARAGFVLKDFHEKLLSQGTLPPRLARGALFGQ